MAYLSINEFPGTGDIMQVEINFAGNRPDAGSGVPPYFNVADVKALRVVPPTASAVGSETAVALTSVNANTFRTSVAIPVGQTLRVYRESQDEYALVDFQALQLVTEDNLDTLSRQTLFVSMEAKDAAGLASNDAKTAISLAVTANSTAAAAVTTANSAVSIANSAVSTANSANTKSDAAVATANSAVNVANLANDASEAAVAAAAEAIEKVDGVVAESTAVVKAATDRFLPPAAANPGTRADGSTLQVGDSYFNTTQDIEYVYDGTAWFANNVDGAAIASQSDATKGATLVGFEGGSVRDVLNIIRALPSYTALRAYFGVSSTVQIAASGSAGLFYRDASDTVSADDGIYVIVDSLGRRWKRQIQGPLSPFMAGVSNDGVTDWTERLRALHSAANKLHVPVDYDGLTVCKVQANANIIINTSVNFANCDFKILGGIVADPDGSTLNTLFTVQDPDVPSYVIPISASELFEGASQITVAETVGAGFLQLASNKRVGNRTTAPTANRYFQQCFMVDRGGILSPGVLGTDLTANTVVATFYPNSYGFIEISNVRADESTFNNQELVAIRRNQVRVRGTQVQPRGLNSTPVSANYLIRALVCGMVEFEDFGVSAQTSVGGSTYGVAFQSCAHVTMTRVAGKGRNTWGVMMSNYVNGLYINDCHLNRVDVHEGLHNLVMRGGSLKGNPIQYGWGSGILHCFGVLNDDPTSPFIRARTDYDNNFNGELGLFQCTWNLGKPTLTAGVFVTPPVIDAEKLGGDAGVVRWANSIVIEDLAVDVVAATDTVVLKLFNQGLWSTSFQVMAPNTIRVSGIRSYRGRVITTFDVQLQTLNAAPDGTCDIYLEDVESAPNTTYMSVNRGNPVSGYAALGGPYRFFVNRFENFSFYCAAPKSSSLRVSNSVINGLRMFSGTASAMRVLVTDSTVDNTIVAGSGSQGEIGAGSAELVIRDVIVRATCSMAVAHVLQGVVTLAGVTNTLPGTATDATAFTGFKTGTIFK